MQRPMATRKPSRYSRSCNTRLSAGVVCEGVHTGEPGWLGRGMDRLVEAITRRFDEFLLDLDAGLLFRLDANQVPTPVPLGSRAFRILCVLTERPGTFVSKQKMMDAVWPGVVVEENNLTVQMSALRRVLDNGRAIGSCIQTVPGRGYRFLPEVISSSAAAKADQALGPSSPSTENGSSEPTEGVPAGRQTVRWQWPSFFRAGAACLSLITLLIAVAWHVSHPWVEKMAAPRLSVVVLPFRNFSGNPAEDYLPEGITQDLTSDLAHLSGAFVIDNATARSYGRNPVDTRQLGRELGVRYVVEGSVSRIGSMLKVNAELISAETGAQLWSDRFDLPFADFASGQEQVLGRMRDGLGIGLVEIEVARGLREHTTKPDAFDLILRGRALRDQPFSQSRRAKARALFEQALRLDPDSVLAMAWTAQMQLNDKMDAGYWPSLEVRDQVKALMDQARRINPNSEAVLTLNGWWQFAEGNCRNTGITARQLIDMFPNNKNFYYILAACDVSVGPADAAIALMQKAALLSPRDPVMYINYRRMGLSSMLIGHDNDAIQWLQRSLAVNPDAPAQSRHDVYRMLAAVYARNGQDGLARQAAAKANRLWPFDTVRDHYSLGDASPVLAAQIRRYQDGLRLSGERDHADENEDFGIPADNVLHAVREGYTPTSALGATTIHTADLAKLISEQTPIILDPLTYFSGRSLPGAFGLPNAGLGGSFNDHAQDRLQYEMQVLTGADMARPIVAVGWNSERFDGCNLARRLVAIGYTHVYWYRGGREAWEAAGLPEADLVPMDW
ncbi:MAG: hypothetical protein QOD93_6529 [Acetobacteraceae bacterium]|nr:hypothetical protein [Acetobacteraceae bacterium]